MPTKFWETLYFTLVLCVIIFTRGNADRRSPLEVLTEKVPSISHLIKFGARCTVSLQHVAANSLRKRSEKVYIISIDTVNNGYDLYLSRTKTYLTSSNINNVDRIDISAAGELVDTLYMLDTMTSSTRSHAQSDFYRAIGTHTTIGPVSEGEESPDHVYSTTEPLADDSGINHKSRNLIVFTQTPTMMNQMSDERGGQRQRV